MKLRFLIGFLLLYATAHSQQLDSKTKSELRKSVDRLSYLTNASQLSYSIYTYSLTWIYFATLEDSKVELKEMLSAEIPKLREQRKALVTDGKRMVSMDSTLIYLDQLATWCSENTRNLSEFKDYYDSTDVSKKFVKSELNLNQNIVPLYRKFSVFVDNLIINERREINEILLNQPEKSKFASARILESLKIVSDKADNRKLSWRLFSGSINWVHRGYDSVSRRMLQSDILIDLNPSSSDEASEQVKAHQFNESFKKLKAEIADIMEKLSTVSEYDDALTFLLAQDKEETEVYPEFLKLEAIAGNNSKKDFANLNMIIAEDADEKASDIRKMLRFNYSTFQLIIKDATESNPNFDVEELISRLVNVYSKRFTHDEIKEILKYQNSKVAKKMQRNSEEIRFEIMQITQDYMKNQNSNK